MDAHFRLPSPIFVPARGLTVRDAARQVVRITARSWGLGAAGAHGDERIAQGPARLPAALPPNERHSAFSPHLPRLVP